MRNSTTRVILLTLAVWLVYVCRPLAQEKSGVSTSPADKAACERQLNIITGAIRQYREQHDNRLPAKLSDLSPEYIHDANVLVCPFVRKRGGLRTWKKFDDLSADPYTSYSYEFPPVEVDHYRWRGLPKKTVQEIKERQVEVLGVLGPVVPIVRCHDHFPWLNLSVGGRIYETESLYWEEKFGTNDDLVIPARLFANPVAPPLLRPEDFPPRDPRANPRLLDLTAYYNARLSSSWHGFAGNNLASLPTGIQEFDGVQFDVRGVIQLRGYLLLAEFPKQVAGIQVRQKCDRIHVLHALSSLHKPGKPQASYVIHYAGGKEEQFLVLYDHHIADWWRDPRLPAPPSHATVAWTGQNEASKAYGTSLRLYHAVWENPLKDIEVETITFDALSNQSKQYFAGPFVVAITLE